MCIRDSSLFKEVLEVTGKAAIGKLVFKSKECLVAIRPYQKGMIMTILHYKNEIIPMEQLEELKHLVVVRESELKLAKNLIEKLSGEFNIEKFKDEYIKAVSKLIKAKAAGKKIKIEKPKKEAELELMEALKASVKQLKHTKKKRS